ncbi:hypothetical protein [Paraburkholderia fungorum]|uniref:hypothetical protein n=1 Tax=Paraburkholderia fungorum TaxID=134537 RepID=UPI001600743D|nr:hypothetical protein [Paraburkholderia fungorum]
MNIRHLAILSATAVAFLSLSDAAQAGGPGGLCSNRHNVSTVLRAGCAGKI